MFCSVLFYSSLWNLLCCRCAVLYLQPLFILVSTSSDIDEPDHLYSLPSALPFCNSLSSAFPFWNSRPVYSFFKQFPNYIPFLEQSRQFIPFLEECGSSEKHKTSSDFVVINSLLSSGWVSS